MPLAEFRPTRLYSYVAVAGLSYIALFAFARPFMAGRQSGKVRLHFDGKDVAWADVFYSDIISALS